MQKLLGNFHYQVIGSDHPSKCAFLHGILGQGKNWGSIARRLSENLQCLLYDQRGHGKSFQPPSGYLVENFSKDLEQILEALGWGEPLRIVGHSMGGRVALDFATRWPERVSQLVIVDIGPSSDWDSMQGILEKIDFVPEPFSSRHEARDFFASEFQQKFKNAMVANFFYTNIVEKAPGQWGWLFHEPGIREALEQARLKDYWAEFRGLKVPTLLIRGEKSTDLKSEDFQKVVDNNPLIQGIVIPDAGHWVHAEQPEATLQALEAFFGIAAPGR